MEEKKLENEAKKGRFAFVLKINDFIVCRRDFRINGFNECSVNSIEFLNTFRKCVGIIKDDLASKSRIYLRLTSPQVFENVAEMKQRIQEGKINLSVPSFIVTREGEDIFVWNGENAEKYEGFYNKSEYTELIGTTKTNPFGIQDCDYNNPCILKFSFLDSEREVMSEIWDGSVYPKFVRTNIDLSNSKNKYKSDGNYAPFESIIIDAFNNSREDIIPIIARELCVVCSVNDRSKYNYTYGGINLNYNAQKYKYSVKSNETAIKQDN